MSEPPYNIIWRHLKSGFVIPFLGAGASLGARPSSFQWKESETSYLPTGRELASLLADEAEFPESEKSGRDDLAKVSSYYVEASDRSSLVARLQELFCHPYQTNHIHTLLAEVPAPMMLVTTNYDALVEDAFTRAGKPFHLVVHPTEQVDNAASVLWWEPGAREPKVYPPSSLPLSLTDTTIIYKMHGSVDRLLGKWQSFVVTEEDYVDFLSRMTGQCAIPARFMLEFRRRRFLFLGYGLADWSLRVLLKNLKANAGGLSAPKTEGAVDLKSWAIQFHPSELEQTLWRARNVNVYDMDLAAFSAKLREEINPTANIAPSAP